jgi:N-acetylneuraminic acid mutarotase
MERRSKTSIWLVFILFLTPAAFLGLSSCQYLILDTGEGPEIGEWVLTQSLTEARSFHAGAVYNGRLYVTGGFGKSWLSEVRYAAPNAYGALSSWSSAYTFGNARSEHGSAAYNNYLYVLGGAAGGAPLSDVQYALIQTDGRLENWEPWISKNNIITTLPSPVKSHVCFIYNGRLYVAGGDNGSTAPAGTIANIRFVNLDSFGRADGDWLPATPINTARKSFTAVAYNGFLYAIGGLDGAGAALDSVEFASINTANGFVGAWSGTTSLPAPLNGHASVLHNGHVYVIGGHDGAGPVDDVLYAKINDDGTLGDWKATTPLPSARWGHVALKNGINVYVIGGATSSGKSPVVLYAQFQ